jgi:catechol 2,3-dioxygenase-like lactoylglutathione lyase family enzyme
LETKSRVRAWEADVDEPIVFGEVTPVVPARDVAAALRFYVEKLGFTEVWRGGEPVTDDAVRRGAVSVMFFACDDPKIAQWTAFRVRSSAVAALYEHCLAQGIAHPDGALRETSWGTREFVVLDQDGVGITFWEPLAAGE